jgi:Spy/CpxP family protein refolding chaperone
MLRVASTVLALVVSLMVVGDLSAAEQKHRHEGSRGGQPGIDRVDMMLKGLTLSEEQKSKIDAVKKEYAPKFKEGGEKLDGILTAEQKADRDEAVKSAKTAGKERREIRQAGMSAVKLTDEQKAKTAEAVKGMQAVQKEFREKIMSVLTPEQKEQVKKNVESRHGGRVKHDVN